MSQPADLCMNCAHFDWSVGACAHKQGPVYCGESRVSFEPTYPCPQCHEAARFVARFEPSIATWNCDNESCRIGGFSVYVWPEPGGKFTFLEQLSDRRLDACINTADISNPILALELRKERERRSKS